MAVETVQGLPAVIESGNTLRWTESFSGYAPATWTGRCYFGFDTPFVVEASISGASHLFEVSSLNAGSFPSGTWVVTFYMFDSGGERTRVDQRTVRINPNAAAVREPSAAENALAACDVALLELAGSPDITVSFNGQSFTKADHGLLFGLRVRLQAEVIREKEERLALAGGADGRAINVRFSNGLASPFLP